MQGHKFHYAIILLLLVSKISIYSFLWEGRVKSGNVNNISNDGVGKRGSLVKLYEIKNIINNTKF